MIIELTNEPEILTIIPLYHEAIDLILILGNCCVNSKKRKRVPIVSSLVLDWF